ncbi:multidrug ABC transporter ATP-binding protein [Streptomyces purpurascens]
MHKGAFHQEGTVAELTRTLPAAIRFSLPAAAPVLPLRATREGDGRFLVETFGLQETLYALLDWAHANGLELRELEAGPTRLDDVFRAIGDD